MANAAQPADHAQAFFLAPAVSGRSLAPVDFQSALAQNPAPQRIGDVRLRYDSPLLLAEADRPPSGLAGPLLRVAGLAAALGCAALLLLTEPVPTTLCIALGLVAAALVAGGARLEERGRHRRRFTLDFEAHTLRLDFTLPPRGLPRSLVLPFERVEALNVLEQPGGAWVLTVDVCFEETHSRVREVLVAGVRPSEAEALASLHRLLEGAFDL